MERFCSFFPCHGEEEHCLPDLSFLILSRNDIAISGFFFLYLWYDKLGRRGKSLPTGIDVVGKHSSLGGDAGILSLRSSLSSARRLIIAEQSQKTYPPERIFSVRLRSWPTPALPENFV